MLFGTCFLANVMAGQISTLMSVYLPDVMTTFFSGNHQEDVHHVGAYINSLYLLGWAIGGFSWGVLSDRIGRPSALASSLACLGLFTLLIRFSSGWEELVIFRLLAGFGTGGVLVITVTYLSEVWPLKSRSIVIGIVSVGFPVGIFSSGLVNLFSGWRDGFLVGVLPLVLAATAVLWLRESVLWKDSSTASAQGVRRQLIFENKEELIHGTLIFGFMLIGLWAVFSWFPTWIQSLLMHSNGQEERGITMMLLGIGGVTGGILSGGISNLLGIRKAMVLCFSGCGLLAILLFGFNTSFSAVIYLETALLSLFFGISQGLLSIYIPQLFPSPIRAGATGFCFNLGRVLTALAVYSLGTWVNLLGGYGNALLVFSSVFGAGLVVLLITKRREDPVHPVGANATAYK